jgi:hypothetical protein
MSEDKRSSLFMSSVDDIEKKFIKLPPTKNNNEVIFDILNWFKGQFWIFEAFRNTDSFREY